MIRWNLYFQLMMYPEESQNYARMDWLIFVFKTRWLGEKRKGEMLGEGAFVL